MSEFVYAKALLGMGIGAVVMIGLSRLTRCNTGSCPITNNWWVAGLYGAALGVFVAFSAAGTSAAPTTSRPVVSTQQAPATQTRPAATQPLGEKMMPKHIDSVASFDREVIQSRKPVLVDFYAVWCGPCRFLAPIIDQIAAELGAKIDVVKVDIDKVMELAERYRIQGVPTIILFSSGKPVRTFVGVRTKAEYLAAIDQTAAVK
jgi:thioredoxin 1